MSSSSTGTVSTGRDRDAEFLLGLFGDDTTSVNEVAAQELDAVSSGTVTPDVLMGRLVAEEQSDSDFGSDEDLPEVDIGAVSSGTVTPDVLMGRLAAGEQVRENQESAGSEEPYIGREPSPVYESTTDEEDDAAAEEKEEGAAPVEAVVPMPIDPVDSDLEGIDPANVLNSRRPRTRTSRYGKRARDEDIDGAIGRYTKEPPYDGGPRHSSTSRLSDKVLDLLCGQDKEPRSELKAQRRADKYWRRSAKKARRKMDLCDEPEQSDEDGEGIDETTY